MNKQSLPFSDEKRKNYLALSSLALDLKRAALGFHRGSIATAERFLEEAIKRKSEVDQTSVKPYIRQLLVNLDNIVKQKDQQKIAEDALMYSTLFQNYIQSRA